MALKVGVVIDPWNYPYNGTVVSTRRFVSALSGQVDFRLLAIPDPELLLEHRITPFPQLSIPGFNGVINRMKVPLANPWSRGAKVEDALQGLDLVHMQFPFFLAYEVTRAANRKGLPLLASFHVQPENLLQNLGIHSPRLTRWLYKLFIWGLYDRADLVLAPSQFAATQLKRHGLTRPIEVLSNGVTKEFFQLERMTNHDDFQVLSVGRLAPEKCQSTILEAVAQSRYKNRIQLRLVGTGPLQAELQKQANKLDLNALIGPVDDETLHRCYQSADLFIHASEIELEGMSVLEAMASGNTVLVSNSKNSATGELIEDRRSQFDHGDAQDLCTKMEYWLSEPEVRQAQGELNRSRAEARNHAASVDQLLMTYERFARSPNVD